MTLAEDLLAWYDVHKRDLPWRNTKDPYPIWLSEIMLQQTRTETVERYYAKFLTAFPQVADLARAEEDQVLKLWEGLGYYSRARNLHAAARHIAFKLDGRFPSDAKGLRTLPGVGPYAANAIASIAYGGCVPALDGNQARVLSRILAWSAPLRTPFDLENPALQHISRERPGDYNQALMDLGASVCTPKHPRCADCPLQSHCLAWEEGDPESFPKKLPPIVKREQPLTVVLVKSNEGFCVRKRPAKGLLAGLYEFPMLEGHLSPEEAVRALGDMGFSGVRFLRALPAAKHVFTHLVWRMNGILVCADALPADWHWQKDLDAVALPSALKVYREIAGEFASE